MAVVRLKRGSDTVDLYGGTDGLKIRHDGWIQNRATQNPDGSWNLVDEALTLRVDGSNANNVATRMQALDNILRRATEYTSRSFGEVDPVYLQARLDDESYMRQALVHLGTTQPAAGMLGPPFTTATTLTDHRLAVTRYPFWETEGAIPLSGTGQGSVRLTSSGDSANHNTNVPGDVPARVSYAAFDISGGGGPLTEVWMGFRSEAYGTPSRFLVNWDCGDTDVSYHNNTEYLQQLNVVGDGVAEWTPGDTTMSPRLTMTMRNVTNRLGDQNGTHLVLMRARRLGGDRTFHVRLLTGFYDGTGASDSSKWRTGKRVLVPGSGVGTSEFFYYQMGTISIPPDVTALESGYIGRFACRIEAQVASGSTGTLQVDALTMIPLSEGAVHLKDAYIYNDSGTHNWARIYSSPDDQTFGFTDRSSGGTPFLRHLEYTPLNWSVPTGRGYIVGAAQRADSQTFGDKFYAWVECYPRWLTLRGSATG